MKRLVFTKVSQNNWKLSEFQIAKKYTWKVYVSLYGLQLDRRPEDTYNTGNEMASMERFMLGPTIKTVNSTSVSSS
jgi:hypothetical protein